MLLAPLAFLLDALHAGRLPIPAAMPTLLTILLPPNRSPVGPVYVSTADAPDEPGPNDQRHLWRLEVDPQTVGRLGRAQALVNLDERDVPPYFWAQPPWWWPDRPPEDAIYLRTSGWKAFARGGENLHYLLMYVPAERAAYFWVKDNFPTRPSAPPMQRRGKGGRDEGADWVIGSAGPTSANGDRSGCAHVAVSAVRAR